MLESPSGLVIAYISLDIFCGLLCSVPAELSEPVEQAVCAPEPSAFCCRPAGIRYWRRSGNVMFRQALVISDFRGV